MLSVIACPYCERLIETDQPDGQRIPCPYCDAGFVIRPELRVRRGSVGNVVARICIPIGYVLFVVLPLTLTIWYFTRRAEPPASRDETAAAPAAPAGAEGKPEPPSRPARPPRKEKAPAWDAEPEPLPVDPAPAAEVELAPAPREAPEAFVAPDPRPVLWKIPVGSYSSPWRTVGAVDIRVAGLAVTKVPVVDPNERVAESAAPLLAVVVEVRANVTSKPRTLTSWTHGLNHYGAIFLANGQELAPAELPRGGKLNTGLAYKQPLPEDGTPVRDVLLFAVPAADAGELSLRLEAERCGEMGDVWFKVPATALKK
ncbi:hypothetical protein [Frigoriglobus tundricola]|uniref:Uncharacterized protein n=1 Tax=Frigoriglobus tundricola TaxID=2774151 RepID=A0A6M5YSQ6_9BACT|nr:hypothetical protein [Frigoriglobus tundricola]QJW97038.1 hypothetical protein FTUN_4601 [Frigoriglobus tundricola]